MPTLSFSHAVMHLNCTDLLFVQVKPETKTKVHLFLKQGLHYFQFIQNKVLIFTKTFQENPSCHQLKYLVSNQMKIVHDTVLKINGLYYSAHERNSLLTP